MTRRHFIIPSPPSGPTMVATPRGTVKAASTSLSIPQFTPSANKSVLFAWCWSDAFNCAFTLPSVNGVAWTKLAAASGNSSAIQNSGSFNFFYNPIADGLASVGPMSCSGNAGSNIGIGICEVTGVDKTNIIDDTVVHSNGNSSTFTALNTGALTTINSKTMVLFVFGSTSSGTGTPLTGTNWNNAFGLSGITNPCFGGMSQYQTTALSAQVLATGDTLNRWDGYAIPIRGV